MMIYSKFEIIFRYDRAATKKLKEQKALRRKKSREVSEAETTATITGDSLETQVADKKDRSVYATERE